MSLLTDPDRRRFLDAAAVTLAAAPFVLSDAVFAQSGAGKPGPGAHTSFAALKQIEAGVLNVGYAEAGPADGPVVILLHGWPYDIYAFVDVVPLLAQAGFRVIAPWLRGYGTTRFLAADAVRNGQQGALALDVVALMDALKVDKAVVAGFDWGARTADIVAAIWPERVKALVSVSGYLIGSQQANSNPLPPAAELQWWYQYYFATERGRLGYEKYRREFSKLIWQLASPKWDFDDATFERSAAAFDNPDHVGIVIHKTAGASGSPTVSRNTTISNGGLPHSRRLQCRPSRSKATRTAHRTRTLARMRRSSWADTRTARLRAGSGTTCRRKPRKLLPTRSWRLPPKADR